MRNRVISLLLFCVILSELGVHSLSFNCDEEGYVKYLNQWSVEEKGSSRDAASEEFKTRLNYFVESCEKIEAWNRRDKFKLAFTFYADWSAEEYEALMNSRQRYSGIKVSNPAMSEVFNNTQYHSLVPALNPCDESSELREYVSKPQACSVSWAFAVTNAIEYAIKKLYVEEYDQAVQVSLSAQELIDCVGKEYGMEEASCEGLPLVWGFDYAVESGIAFSEFYPHTNRKGECVVIEDDNKKYHIAGYEKPTAYNKLGLFELARSGPVAVTLGLDPEFFQFYDGGVSGPFFDKAFWRPSVYGVLKEYRQYAEEGKSELAEWPFFVVESRLRGCDAMAFKLPILDGDDGNVGGIAGFAIRPIVMEALPSVVPTGEAPTVVPTGEVPVTYVECWSDEPVSASITELVVDEGKCGDVTEVDLSKYSRLERIVFGANSFQQAKSLTLSNMNSLVSVVFKEGAFRYADDLWLDNLPVLETLDMEGDNFNGSEGGRRLAESGSGIHISSSSLKRLTIPKSSFKTATVLEISDTPLEQLTIMDGGLPNVKEVTISNVDTLQKVKIGKGALSSCEVLTLTDCNIDAENVDDLFELGEGALPNLKTIQVSNDPESIALAESIARKLGGDVEIVVVGEVPTVPSTEMPTQRPTEAPTIIPPTETPTTLPPTTQPPTETPTTFPPTQPPTTLPPTTLPPTTLPPTTLPTTTIPPTTQPPTPPPPTPPPPSSYDECWSDTPVSSNITWLGIGSYECWSASVLDLSRYSMLKTLRIGGYSFGT